MSNNQVDEQNQVKHDLIFTVLMNAIFFAILIGLYFFNQSTGKVDSFFAQILKF